MSPFRHADPARGWEDDRAHCMIPIRERLRFVLQYMYSSRAHSSSPYCSVSKTTQEGRAHCMPAVFLILLVVVCGSLWCVTVYIYVGLCVWHTSVGILS